MPIICMHYGYAAVLILLCNKLIPQPSHTIFGSLESLGNRQRINFHIFQHMLSIDRNVTSVKFGWHHRDMKNKIVIRKLQVPNSLLYWASLLLLASYLAVNSSLALLVVSSIGLNVLVDANVADICLGRALQSPCHRLAKAQLTTLFCIFLSSKHRKQDIQTDSLRILN